MNTLVLFILFFLILQRVEAFNLKKRKCSRRLHSSIDAVTGTPTSSSQDYEPALTATADYEEPLASTIYEATLTASADSEATTESSSAESTDYSETTSSAAESMSTSGLIAAAQDNSTVSLTRPPSFSFDHIVQYGQQNIQYQSDNSTIILQLIPNPNNPSSPLGVQLRSKIATEIGRFCADLKFTNETAAGSVLSIYTYEKDSSPVPDEIDIQLVDAKPSSVWTNSNSTDSTLPAKFVNYPSSNTTNTEFHRYCIVWARNEVVLTVDGQMLDDSRSIKRPWKSMYGYISLTGLGQKSLSFNAPVHAHVRNVTFDSFHFQ